MAKKIVRGITDVKTINNQDYDTNNVNDLLSDGQYNYIHRKKGKSEEYHNLTDNIKTLSSDNTELLSVTNNNKTTNTATLHPKHDAQKEQVLESQNNTITINHGTNGTDEKTKIDVNTHNVLTHNNLVSSSPLLTVEHQDGLDTTTIKATALEETLRQIFEAISSGGAGGETLSIQKFSGDGFEAYTHVVKSGGQSGGQSRAQRLTTFVFECSSGTAEWVLTGQLKEALKYYVIPNYTISNGAVTITYDGTNMKLINNKSTESGSQQGTFTFHQYTSGGGGSV